VDSRRAKRHRALLACGLFVFVWTLTTRGKPSDLGDEPHYLMIARSLVRDHDLDLSNNYAAADRLVAMGPHARIARDGTLQSVHDIGLPLLLVPIYAVSERLTAAAPVSLLRRLKMPTGLFEYSLISLSILAAVSVAITWLAAALDRVTSHPNALFITGIVAVSPPVLAHSFLVFPEAIAFIVMCGVVWWLLSPASASWTTWALAAALGYLPWCHRKFSPLVIACAILLVAARPDRRRAWSTATRMGLAAVLILPHVTFYWWTWRTWGHFGGPQLIDGSPFFAAGAAQGFIGLIMDRQSGLIADAPVYLAIAACWALSSRSTRALLWPVASLVIPMSAYAVWWAGFSPAARYLVPIMPFCAVALADSSRHPVIRATTATLATVQVFVVAAAWDHPRSLWPRLDGTNPLLHALGPVGRAYASFLPGVQAGEWDHAVASAGALAGLNLFLWWLARRGQPTSSS
jgi:hypothetical protein